MNKKHPYYDNSMWKGAPVESFAKARLLRSKMTEAETKLWNFLKKPSFTNHKFRCQHPIQKFIVDFYCHAGQLVIEIDGGYHKERAQQVADEDRSEILKFQGLKVIRFTNEQVLEDVESVLKKIKEAIEIE